MTNEDLININAELSMQLPDGLKRAADFLKGLVEGTDDLIVTIRKPGKNSVAFKLHGGMSFASITALLGDLKDEVNEDISYLEELREDISKLAE